MKTQKDIAFKVMYILIVFMIATVALTYKFFQMVKEQEQEIAQKKIVEKRQ